MTLLTTFLLAAVPLTPQNPPAYVDTPEDHEFAWPTVSGFGQNGSVARSVAGLFTGDRWHDAAIVRDDVLVLMSGPGIYESFSVLISSGVIDVEVLPGGADDGQDALVATTDDGLVWMGWDDSSGLIVSTTIGGTAWDGALMVRAGDFEGDSDLDLVGVGSDGSTVLTLPGTGTSFGSTSSFTIAPVILDLVLLDWNPYITGDELAFATTSGLRIFRWGGPPRLAALHSNYQEDCLGVLPGGADGEELFWMTGAPDGDQVIVLTSRTPASGSQTEEDSNAAQVNETTEVEGGGFANVTVGMIRYSMGPHVILNRAEQGLLFILEEGSSTRFDVEATSTRHLPYDIYTPVANTANPLLAPFDDDGANDVLITAEGRETVSFWLNESIPTYTQDNPGSVPPQEIAETALIATLTDNTNPQAPITVEAVLTVQIDDPPSGTTDYRVIVWIQDDADGEGRPEAVNTSIAPLQTTVGELGNSYVRFVLPYDLSPAASEGGAVFFVELEPLDSNEDHNGRALVAIYSRSYDSATEAGNTEVDYYPTWDDPMDPDWEWSNPSGGYSGGSVVAGFIRGRRIMKFPPGVLPDPDGPSHSVNFEHSGSTLIGDYTAQ